MRLEGYKRALAEYKIPLHKTLIRHLDKNHAEYSMENGYQLMKELLKEGTTFTAVYAISDLMAIGALRALHEAGRKVPEECAVAGFDGLSYTAYYIPSVTTVVQPVEEMAKESVKSLFQMIESKKGVPGKILPARLAERQSTLGTGPNASGPVPVYNSEVKR